MSTLKVRISRLEGAAGDGVSDEWVRRREAEAWGYLAGLRATAESVARGENCSRDDFARRRAQIEAAARLAALERWGAR